MPRMPSMMQHNINPIYEEMKKRIVTLSAFVAIIVMMTSCDRLFAKHYNVDAMIDDYILYQEKGDQEKAQKLYDKLMELEDQLTDDQYYRFEAAQ